LVELCEHVLGRWVDSQDLAIAAELAQSFVLKHQIGAVGRCRRADLERPLIGVAAAKDPSADGVGQRLQLGPCLGETRGTIHSGVRRGTAATRAPCGDSDESQGNDASDDANRGSLDP
jgi:hypothetical protein